MPDWGSALTSSQRAVDAGAVTATSLGTTLTAGASANTKGSWVQLIASTTFAASWILICGSQVTVSGLIDIGVGGAGSEYVVIPNLYISAGSATTVDAYGIPCAINSGVRVAARCQTTSASGQSVVSIVLIGG